MIFLIINLLGLIYLVNSLFIGFVSKVWFNCASFCTFIKLEDV